MNKKTIYVALAAMLTGVVLWKGLLSGGDSAGENLPVFDSVRGDLMIHVLEGGNIRAMEYLEIKNEVNNRSNTKVLSLVEEGYEVTEQDVLSATDVFNVRSRHLFVRNRCHVPCQQANPCGAQPNLFDHTIVFAKGDSFADSVGFVE